MSTRASRGAPPKVTGRISQRKKMVLDVDLNAPACETCSDVGTSSHASSRAQQVQHDHPPLRSQQLQDGEHEVPPRPMPIDVDSIVDDDVVFSSPTAFAEAKTNSRRNRGRTVVDVDSEESRAKRAVNARNKRQRLPSNLTVINCESYVNLESGANNMQSSMMPPPPPPPKEPTFSCPVCMGPLVEEMSTKCGHIFCKGCIKAAIAAQGKCPTCRRKVTMKDTIRIYLPATS